MLPRFRELRQWVANMHIVLGILAALGAVAFFIIRANHAAQATRELGEAAAEAQGFFRRMFWRRRTNVDLVRANEDPRLAATVMMCAVAKSDSDFTEREGEVILERMAGMLELEGAEAEEMLAHARWLTNDMKDLSAFLRRAAKAIETDCNAAEKAGLIEMLGTVAAVDSAVSDIQRDAIQRLQRELGLDRP